MHWTNMFTRLMARTIAGGFQSCIMWGHANVISMSMRLVCFPSGWSFEKFFATPERHRHQSRHIKSSAGGSDGAYNPDKPAHRNVSRRSCVPKNFIFGPETAKWNDAANSQPSCQESQVRIGHVFLQSAHTSHVLFVMHAVNHAACAKKHQRFEKSVRHHVEY